ARRRRGVGRADPRLRRTGAVRRVRHAEAGALDRAQPLRVACGASRDRRRRRVRSARRRPEGAAGRLSCGRPGMALATRARATALATAAGPAGVRPAGAAEAPLRPMKVALAHEYFA